MARAPVRGASTTMPVKRPRPFVHGTWPPEPNMEQSSSIKPESGSKRDYGKPSFSTLGRGPMDV